MRRWVFAILTVFALLGFGFGSWLSRLPAIRDHLGATTLEMSVYGLCLALGSVTGLLFSGRTVSRLGPRRTLAAGIVVQALAMPSAALLIWGGLLVPGLAVLFCFGFVFSTSDVAMNVSGASAERALGRPRMPMLHAGFSLGSVSAMGAGAAAESLGLPVPAHLAIVFGAIAVAGLLSLRLVPREEQAPDERPDEPGPAAHSTKTGPIPTVTGSVPVVTGSVPTITGAIPVVAGSSAGAEDAAAGGGAARQPARSPWRDPRILLIGLIAMSMSLAEGTSADWLPLALADGRGVANEVGALILGTFFVAMTLTRLAGSPILSRFGRVAVLRGGAVLCGIGVVIVILAPVTWGIVAGTLCWGIGCALGFPVAISAAADKPATAVRDVAAVASIAYTALLLGPMAFGFLGEHIGLLTSFWVLAAVALLSALLAGAAREPERSAR
ncbi:MFS transporter [Leucobacter sp. CSA1]|uniref:MFS transporter n=1 Tax=Leucobacter chromiisoli TaxID=2796471 RepID=A0A934Q8Q3_9MICO|nr:MFS transporter [Leucobacter chromiisoli]